MKGVITRDLAERAASMLRSIHAENADAVAAELLRCTEDSELVQFYQEGALNHSLLSEGTLEVDEDACVSEGDDSGAYVQAWLWVDEEEMMRHKLISEGNPAPTQDQIDDALAKLKSSDKD